MVCLTATKFEPLLFPVLVFVFSFVSNIEIFVILYDFCLLPDIIVNVRNFERQM